MDRADIQLSQEQQRRCIISAARQFGEPHMSLDARDVVNAGKARLTALSVQDLVVLLQRSGSRHVSVDGLRADLAAGAPQNADGTINLIAYGAWLVRELARREGGHAG